MANKVRQRYRIQCDGFDGIFHKLFSAFHDVETRIYLQAQCREAILKGKFNNEKYLLDRIPSIVDSYYYFADLGIEKITLSFEDSSKNEIKEIINHLLQDPITLNYVNLKLKYDKEEIARKLMGSTHLKKIIFYEIDSIHFSRMIFIHWLSSKGFSVEFRIPYQQKFRNIYKYWENVYRIITNQKTDKFKAHPGTEMKNGQKFSCFYENMNLNVDDRKDVRIVEFETPYDFASYFEEKPDKFIAVNPAEIEPLIEASRVPLYEDGVGKFIYHIQFCRIKNGKVYLSFETLTELLTSSWIYTKNSAGTKALALLIDLQEYMSGIETIEEVKERLQRLLELEIVSQAFDRENAEDAGRIKMKRYMLNPFRTFAFLNSDRYQITINQLLELVDLLERFCKYLILEENATMNVNEYFKRWVAILERQLGNREDMDAWKGLFLKEYPDTWEFAIQELLQLLYLRISAKTDKKRKIIPISAVQEMILDKNHLQPLHLTNLSHMNFPESYSTSFTDLFTYSELKACIQLTPYNKSVFYHSLWVDYAMVQNFEELGIYRLYTILKDYQGPIIISWIKHLQEDDFRNVILDILADLYCDGKIVTYESNEVSLPEYIENRILPEEIAKAETAPLKGKIPGLFWLDHDFCSKKFFLTAIIEQQQVYETDFHHRLLFSKIGKLFSFSKAEKEEFKELIFPLFPLWTRTHKENMIDTEVTFPFRKYKTYENISYPHEMKGLHILRSVYRENRRTKARNQYRKDRGFQDKELLKQFSENISTFQVKGEPGNHCKMCPHLQSCTEGMYSIDSSNQ